MGGSSDARVWRTQKYEVGFPHFVHSRSIVGSVDSSFSRTITSFFSLTVFMIVSFSLPVTFFSLPHFLHFKIFSDVGTSKPPHSQKPNIFAFTDAKHIKIQSAQQIA